MWAAQEKLIDLLEVEFNERSLSEFWIKDRIVNQNLYIFITKEYSFSSVLIIKISTDPFRPLNGDVGQL